ncbi:MAG TPA: helix-hairpin-helix domain-containing protein [Thermoanaerobaculia bacterium]|nr:helix-hairpin-helix domain-containing protein [Thermoanaerobaculia bacterium]
MRKSHSILFLALILATVCASAFADAPSGVVNINTADAAQLSLLPRVGMKAAQRIVDYRTQNGPFHKLTDLMQVKGFGDKTFERVKPYITLDGKSTLTAKVQGPRKPRAKAARQQPSSTASK